MPALISFLVLEAKSLHMALIFVMRLGAEGEFLQKLWRLPSEKTFFDLFA
jgi:hypothetical protein